jgi:hypothetical protein
MRFSLLGASGLVSLMAVSSASALAMSWTPIGNPGNAADTTSLGAVSYGYSIGTYEVTNGQYVEFLNAKAAADPLGLYNTNMAGTLGGITRSGGSGSYTYSTIAGRENVPVTFVSFYDSLRFANWLSNGQGSGDTETGSYTLLGGAAIPSNGTTVTRNAGATIVLPTDNEWYKAAYYDPFTSTYFDYPTASNTQPTCAAPTAAPNRANCSNAVGNLTIVGSYPGSLSPSGLYDMAGNVGEWSEAIRNGTDRAIFGGGWEDFGFPAGGAGFDPSSQNSDSWGIRVALVPEPGTGVLLLAGLLGLAARGWARRAG